MFKEKYIKKYTLSIYRKRRNRSLFCIGVVISLVVLFSIYYFIVRRGMLAGAEQQPKNALKVEETSIELYPVFCQVGSTNLFLSLPVEIFDVLGLGYHQASEANAFELMPLGEEIKLSKGEKIVLKKNNEINGLSYFIMFSRGRDTSPTSAADIAVTPNTWIRSPIDGRVTKIKTYYLYDKFEDFHVEIEPLGHPELRLVLIHLDDLDVKEGDIVKDKETLLGKVRDFGQKFESQIERHIPKECDHVHLQVNKHVEGED
ncbi:M23 family metallopeptidase [Candidatus Oleimmundimicrobium sp.]|uniref:M23 family metallopeptidase n=1 Tax=Candidatus Oleimmundimicrobium sp. TaxID=3060597 RepID=UPI0027187CF2|nr:M23 family metallopeptidase [Candidatus Oleimmundimicrobium sp.]MDO8886526.1 M23 family metallopeptidase [Candidatus Oleimmundimicrobium sp.]